MKGTNEDKSGSLLKAGIVAAPLGAGIGFSAAQRINSARVQPAQSVLQTATEFAVKQKVPEINFQSHLDYIQRKNTFFSTEKGVTAAKTAWRQALKSADPLTKKNFDFTDDFKKASDILDRMNEMSRRNKGSQTHKIFSSFSRNLDVLEKQTELPNMVAANRITNFPIESAIAGKATSGLPPSIKSYFERFGLAGSNLRTRAYSRPGWQEQGLGMYRTQFEVKGLNVDLMVPTSSKGQIATGLTQQTRRIAPDVVIYDAATKQFRRLKRHEFFLEAFERNVLSDVMEGKITTQRQVNAAIKALNEETILKLQSVPNVPAGMQPRGAGAYAGIRGHAVDIVLEQEPGERKGKWRYTPRFRAPTESELPGIMSATGLRGGTSPTNIAKGRLTEFDFSKFSMTPSATDYSRRPDQAVREWYAADSAKAAMRASRRQRRWAGAFETPEFREAMGREASPHMRTMYVDPKKMITVTDPVTKTVKEVSALEHWQVGDGESLVSKRMRNMMTVEKMKSVHLQEARADLAEKIASGQLAKGEILGYTEAGKAVTYQPSMRLLGATTHVSEGRGEYLSLHYAQRKAMGGVEKFFGDWKGLGRFMGTADINVAAREMGKDTFLHGQNIDTIVSMDTLKKNQHLHNKQMLTELFEATRRSKSKQFIARNMKLASFMRNPRAFAALLEQQATVATGAGTAFDRESFTRNLMKFAVEKARVTTPQFGSIFGAVPAVFGDETAERLAREALGERAKMYGPSMFGGVAGGVSQVMFGKPAKETGAGALGSFEPRGYEMMKSGSLGPVGADIADELAARAAVSQPEKLATHRELSTVLGSIAGKVKPGKGDVVRTAKGLTRKGLEGLLETGGYLSLGRGMGDVYVPSAQSMSLVRPFETASGQVISGDLPRKYRDLGVLARGMHKGDVAEAEVRAAVDDLTAFVGKHQAAGGKGAGGVLRGKLLGSMSFTGVSRGAAPWRAPDMYTVGVGEDYAQRMVDDMVRAGAYDERTAARTMAQLKAGESVGVTMARHPFIGQYSAQFAKMQVIPGEKEAIMAIPSRGVQVGFKGIEGTTTLNMSPLVGLAGDLDADTYSLTMVSPDNEKKIMRTISNADSEFVNRYTQHQVRMQMMSAKAAKAAGGADQITTLSKMAADVRKLGTAQTWVPQVSNQLAAARRAVQSFGKGARSADAMFLLEWLEEVPISGKHAAAEDVLGGKLATNMQTIMSAINDKDAVRLENSVRSIASMNEATQSLLDSKLVIDKGYDEIARATRGRVTKNIEGINLSQTVNDIMESMRASEAAGFERETEIMMGKGSRLRQSEIPTAIKISNMVSRSSMMQGVSRMATATKNVLAAAGQGVSRYHKPIGFGFAGSLALAAVLSEPPQMVGSGSENTARDNEASNAMMGLGGSGKVSDETVLPEGQRMGQPTAPSPIVNRSRVTPEFMQSRVDIMMNAGSGASMQHVANSLNNVTGGSYNVNMNISDNRSSLNPHLALNELM